MGASPPAPRRGDERSPERDRDAILLRYFDDRPFADIGARLRLTENAARMRVERALDQLHAALGRRGLRSTAATLGVALANQAALAVPAGLAATVTGTALAGAVVAAAGATGGATAAIGSVAGTSFMALSKLQVGVAALVVAAGVGTVVVYQREPHTPPTEVAAPTPPVVSATRLPSVAPAATPPAPPMVAAPAPVV